MLFAKVRPSVCHHGDHETQDLGYIISMALPPTLDPPWWKTRLPLASVPILHPMPTPVSLPDASLCEVNTSFRVSCRKNPGFKCAAPNRARSSALERKPPLAHL